MTLTAAVGGSLSTGFHSSALLSFLSLRRKTARPATINMVRTQKEQQPRHGGLAGWPVLGGTEENRKAGELSNACIDRQELVEVVEVDGHPR